MTRDAVISNLFYQNQTLEHQSNSYMLLVIGRNCCVGKGVLYDNKIRVGFDKK